MRTYFQFVCPALEIDLNLSRPRVPIVIEIMLEQLRKFHEPWNRHPRVPNDDQTFLLTLIAESSASDKTLTMKMNEKMLVLPSDSC